MQYLFDLQIIGKPTTNWAAPRPTQGGSNEPPDLVLKRKLYIIFFDPYNKNLNTLTLNFLLNPIEISLNVILGFSLCLICIYVFLVFLYVRSSILISALHISKSEKYFTIYSNSKRVTACIFKKPYTSKAIFYYQSVIFLSFALTPRSQPFS